MAWYISYRAGGSTVMHIFKRRELAITAACELLGRGSRDALEVGPMLETRQGNVLYERDLQRIRSATPASATRALSAERHSLADTVDHRPKNLTTGVAVTMSPGEPVRNSPRARRDA